MSTLEMFDGSLDPSVFLDTFAYIFLCRSFIYPAESRMWSVSEFASQVEIVWNVVIWTISSQFYIERCFDFCKREFVQLPFQKWSFSCKNKANQIWLAVSCIVSVLCVWGGVGCAPGNTTEKPRDFVEVHSCVELRWCWSCGRIDWWSMVLGSCLGWCLSSKGVFFFHGWKRKRLQGVLLENPHVPFFLLFCCFGTFLLTFFCVWHILCQYFVVWLCLIKLGLYSVV